MQQTTDYVLTKLVAALNSLSDRELETMAKLLADPAVSITLSRLLTHTMNLRQLERERTSVSRDVSAPVAVQPEEAAKGPTPVRAHSPDGLRLMFIRFLRDRRAFASTVDVVNAINSHFRIHLPYEKFKRSGRERVIKDILKYLARLSPGERQRQIVEFFHKYKGSVPERNEYRELFTTLLK